MNFQIAEWSHGERIASPSKSTKRKMRVSVLDPKQRRRMVQGRQSYIVGGILFVHVYRLRPILEAKDRLVDGIVENHYSIEIVV